MKEVAFSAILEGAQRCYKEKKKWHFHILTPSCSFNTVPGKFVIIFEDEEKNEKIFTTYGERPLQDGEKLEALFYGRV
jgi:hypothetical protein